MYILTCGCDNKLQIYKHFAKTDNLKNSGCLLTSVLSAENGAKIFERDELWN